ncbi:unnamed protein product, partial [Candidula unifasciata]
IVSSSNLNSVTTPKRKSEIEDSNKVFTQSAKAKQIQRLADTGQLYKNEPGLTDASTMPANPSRQSYDDRTVINANTRSIAALAAKKRYQATTVSGANERFGARPLYRPQPHIDDSNFDDFGSILTPSRLAQHNRNMEDSSFGFGIGDDALEKVSVFTDQSLPPLRTIGGIGSRHILEQEEARRAAVRYNGNSNSNGSHLEKSRNQTRTTSKRQRSKQRRKLSTTNGLRLKADDASTVRSITPNTVHSDKNKRISNTSSTRKNKKSFSQVPVAVHNSDNSGVSTPQREQRTSKVLPSIPQYRKGDITVTGTATNAAKY